MCKEVRKKLKGVTSSTHFLWRLEKTNMFMTIYIEVSTPVIKRNFDT